MQNIISRRVSLISLLLLFVLPLSAQDHLNGARVSSLTNPKDSLLVLRSSVYYSGINASETGLETLYNKWVQDNDSKKKYYPLIYEAWKLCIDKCPEQLNLYLDGILLHRWMIQASETTDEKEHYFEELMNVWDLRADNADLINANVRNKHLQTSSNSIRMNKISDWRTYSPYAPTNTDSMYVACYDMYLPIINDIREDIGNGNSAGNDLNTSQLLDFFNASFSHYANEVNKIGKGPEDELYAQQFSEYQHNLQLARQEYDRFVDSLQIPSRNSIRTQAQADIYNQKTKEKSEAIARYNATVLQLNDSILPLKERNENRLANLRKSSATVLLDHYQMIKLIADNVLSSLSSRESTPSHLSDPSLFEATGRPASSRESSPSQLSDPSLFEATGRPASSSAASDSLASRYSSLVAYCQSLIRNNAHLDDDASTIDQIVLHYGDSIRLHTNDYAWLNNLVSKFRYTVDFDSTDPDFLNVVRLRDLAYSNLPNTSSTQQPSLAASSLSDPSLYQATSRSGSQPSLAGSRSSRNYGQLANNAYNRGRSTNDARYFVLAYHYYTKALKASPSNASFKTYRSDCLRFIRSEGFFQGLKKGSVLSFSGESMIIP